MSETFCSADSFAELLHVLARRDSDVVGFHIHGAQPGVTENQSIRAAAEPFDGVLRLWVTSVKVPTQETGQVPSGREAAGRDLPWNDAPLGCVTANNPHASRGVEE